jgi:predicted DCC family thiol-disulfide oxidoreductase YuxK
MYDQAMLMNELRDDSLVIVYDGKCPFCTNYVRLMTLRQAIGHVDVVDARSDAVVVDDLRSKGYDLDEGMAALYGGKVYYGADAVSVISLLSGDGKWVAKSLARLLRDSRRARFLYPLMKLGRRLVLSVLGIPNIEGERRKVRLADADKPDRP